ncbi:predicted protein [Candida tropicalis MYA-3404]|uniref:Uncharacterized protein n=1 Tax=Candida tropicalis (strain ATCC MYA-3404 / T1) TaxID=294747 RepID=C5M6F1_CANTT|nr:predicted protein [Candida tropicalis MYA-3404]EER34571.1 predicted protein [Candida tropicalis MYA-3404]KAG4408444.1 hypothetical protein JTP64_001750 [Candida tropicalis]
MSISSLSHQLSSSTLSLKHQSSIYTLKPRSSNTTLKLKHQPSQLELIDDTTFTSLPLPPPKRYCSNGTTTTATIINNNSTISSPLSQSIEKFDYNDVQDYSYFDDDDDDDDSCYYDDNCEFSESNDTEIVLVEDYFTCPSQDNKDDGKFNTTTSNNNQNRLWKIFYAISYKYKI